MSGDKRPSSSSSGARSLPLASWVGSEALGCVLVMLLLIPLCSALESRGAVLTSLLAHAVGVVVVDLLSAATLSPNFCLGMLLAGRVSGPEAAVRAAVDLLVCSACCALLAGSRLLRIPLPAPAPGVSLAGAFAVEAALAGSFFVVILFIVSVIPSFEIRRPIVALTLRVLITLGAPFTGAYFNPMIALPFAMYHGRVDSAFLLVYCLGPVCGTVAGLAVWNAIQVTTATAFPASGPSPFPSVTFSAQGAAPQGPQDSQGEEDQEPVSGGLVSLARQ